MAAWSPPVFVPAADVGVVTAFYAAILGEPLATRATDNGPAAIFVARERDALIVLPAAPGRRAPGTVRLQARCAPEEMQARLRKARLALRLRPVAEDGEWRVFETRDPEGNRVLVAIQTEQAVERPRTSPG
jgi:glyoxalase superfamily protein